LTQRGHEKSSSSRGDCGEAEAPYFRRGDAGLSASEVDDILALLSGLKEQGVAVIMIEHVMRAVMKFSERIAVLVAGRKIADGDLESWPETRGREGLPWRIASASKAFARVTARCGARPHFARVKDGETVTLLAPTATARAR